MPCNSADFCNVVHHRISLCTSLSCAQRWTGWSSIAPWDSDWYLTTGFAVSVPSPGLARITLTSSDLISYHDVAPHALDSWGTGLGRIGPMSISFTWSVEVVPIETLADAPKWARKNSSNDDKASRQEWKEGIYTPDSGPNKTCCMVLWFFCWFLQCCASSYFVMYIAELRTALNRLVVDCPMGLRLISHHWIRSFCAITWPRSYHSDIFRSYILSWCCSTCTGLLRDGLGKNRAHVHLIYLKRWGCANWDLGWCAKMGQKKQLKRW